MDDFESMIEQNHERWVDAVRNNIDKPEVYPRDGIIELRQSFLDKFLETDDPLFYHAIWLCNAVMWYEDNTDAK